MNASAQAADFTVTNLGDSGAGSLRQAILDSNGAPGADRVLFKSGLSGTVSLTGGQLSITGPGEGAGARGHHGRKAAPRDCSAPLRRRRAIRSRSRA